MCHLYVSTQPKTGEFLICEENMDKQRVSSFIHNKADDIIVIYCWQNKLKHM